MGARQQMEFDRYVVGLKDAIRRYEEAQEREAGKVREAVGRMWRRIGFNDTPPSSPR